MHKSTDLFFRGKMQICQKIAENQTYSQQIDHGTENLIIWAHGPQSDAK